MLTKTYNLTNNNVTLTTYILGESYDDNRAYSRPAILILPGGGYSMCSNREAEPIAMQILSMGYNAFVLRYSLKEASIFPQPLNDVDEAMELIVKNAEEWQTDPDKIAVCGFSAGGHLAAAFGTMGKIRPAGMILGYPCITDDICNKYKVLYNNNNLPLPIDHIDDKTPPAFIFAASDDTIVPVCSSLEFANALSKNKTPFELHIYSSGGHGFSTADYVTIDNIEELNCSSWLCHVKTWLYTLFFNKGIDK